MKKILIIIISLFLMPIIVNAETITYNICKSGCEYSTIISVFDSISSLDSPKDIILTFKDSESYLEDIYWIDYNNYNINTIKIEGNNAYIYGLFVCSINNLSINNLRVTRLGIAGINNTDYVDENIAGYYNNNLYKNNQAQINNITFINDDEADSPSSNIFQVSNATLNVHNTTFNNTTAYIGLSDVTFNNSIIDGKILSGHIGVSPAFSTNIYILSNNTINNIKRQYILFDYYSFDINNHSFIEVNLKEEETQGLVHSGINIDFSNNIYYYQEVNKTIKKNISISEFESEFKNTYEDSIGYDDIKDLPIEWKSENESIATIDNGTIKPIANGQVDLVGTRGNDIYTIHLTVDMPAKKTNEKKGRMAPSTKIAINSVFKDLDISTIDDDVWEISDPSVAKIVNGEIISLAKGETDIVATINGVKYIYHLTVGDTLVSKEIKVPITDKNIKLWIVIVGILLLSVIGTCIFLLIKKK